MQPTVFTKPLKQGQLQKLSKYAGDFWFDVIRIEDDDNQNIMKELGKMASRSKHYIEKASKVIGKDNETEVKFDDFLKGFSIERIKISEHTPEDFMQLKQYVTSFQKEIKKLYFEMNSTLKIGGITATEFEIYLN